MGSDDHGRSPELDSDKDTLLSRVSELERTVQRYEAERLQLQASYEEALQALADSEAKKESSERELKLAHDQISSMWKELESVRKKLDDSSMKTSTPVNLLPVTPEAPNDVIELYCTLCKAKIKQGSSGAISATPTDTPPSPPRSSWFFGRKRRIQELDAHSKVCTSTPSGPSPSSSTSSTPSTSSPKKAPTEVSPSVAKGKKPLPQPSQALGRRLLPDPAPILRGDKKAVPPQGEEILQVNVTRSPPGEPELAPFKIITKTNLTQFSHSPVEVHRSQGDIQWLYEVLLDTSPERVVPPLKPPISLDATVSEFQRFLSRIAAHKVLKRHHMFVVFLSGTVEEMRTLRAKHRVSQDIVQFKPAVGRDTKSGPLVATKEYLVSLEHHLLGLSLHMEQATRLKTSTEKTAHWFRALSESEPADTYLKVATGDLARTCESVEGHQIDTDDTLFIQSLQSIADYVKAAQDLLTRVEEAVDKFLYWDEEVSIMEAVTSSPNPQTTGESTDEVHSSTYDDSGVSDISGHSSKNSSEPVAHPNEKDSDGDSISERWAQASKYCSDAKDYLEMMCKDLSEELSQFDLRKETELKQVLLDYAAAQLEKHEKFRGKWFAMKYLLDADIMPAVRAIQFTNSEQAPSAPD